MKRALAGANVIDPFPSEYATEAAKRNMEPDIKLYQFVCGEVTYDAAKLADISGEVKAWIQDAVDSDRVQRLYFLPEQKHTAEFVLKVCRRYSIIHNITDWVRPWSRLHDCVGYFPQYSQRRRGSKHARPRDGTRFGREDSAASDVYG